MVAPVLNELISWENSFCSLGLHVMKLFRKKQNSNFVSSYLEIGNEWSLPCLRVGILGYQSFWCWDQNIPVRLGNYHSCWCLGSLHRQAISSHDFDCVQCGYPCVPMEWMSTTCDVSMLRIDIIDEMQTYLCFLAKNHSFLVQNIKVTVSCWQWWMMRFCKMENHANIIDCQGYSAPADGLELLVQGLLQG